MRNLNFIKPVSAARIKELRRWCLFSLLALISSIVMISFVTATQIHIYRQLHQEQHALAQQLTCYDQVMNNHRSHIQEQEALQKKITHLDTVALQPKTPLAFLEALYAMKSTTPLISFRIDDTRFELKGSCPSASHALKLVQHITTLPLCTQAQLQSLTMQNNQMVFVIDGICA